MPEERTILSLTFNLTVQEVESTDETGNTVAEELYSIKCEDSVCWELATEKDGAERGHEFVRLQIVHIGNHLRAGLERRANRIGEESYFAAAKQMPYVSSGEWKKKGLEFFEQRVQSYQDRARQILSIRRGRPQRLTKAKMAKLPERYERLHAKFKEIKKRHNEEIKKAERERRRQLSHTERTAHWLSVAKQLYPKEHHGYLRQIADPDRYASSPSQVAYLALASENGYDPEYMQKLVRKARKARTD